MNLFLANSLNISIQLLFAVLVIVSLLLLGVVLMQRPKQEGLGAAFGATITDQASVPAKTPEELQQEELRRRAAEAEAASSQAPAPAVPEAPAPVSPEAPAPAN